MIFRKRLLVVSFLLLSSIGFADNNPLWMRYPAISPDGNTIVFSYKGDLYLVPSKGGNALPLTTHEAHDFMPVWSPDSKSIAFASDRFGNFDIYLSAITGGVPERLTFHSAAEYPTSFTPDGKSVLFSSQIMDDYNNVQFPYRRLPELYKVTIDGGAIKQLLTTPAEEAKYNNTGNKIIYIDYKGYEDKWRKHHTSPVTRDIWLFDTITDKHEKLTSFNGEDRSPQFNSTYNDVFYLSEQFGSFNVCKLSLLNPAEVTQVTFHKNHPVRFLTISSNNTLCYGYNGEIYTKTESNDPQKVNITIATDEKNNNAEFTTFTKGATEMEVSPDGKEIVFVVRGEVFVTSVDYSTTKRITNTPEQERSASFSKNGRSILYASERNNSWNIYQTKIVRDDEPNFATSTILKEEPILEIKEETFQPYFSPDGKEVAFLQERTELKVINLETKDIRSILKAKYNYSYSDGDQWYEWSPDGKWILVGFAPHNFFLDEVGLVSADGNGEIINLTNSGYNDIRPRWMMDGKMMIWLTDKNGYRSHGSWGSERDVYGMFFTQDAFDKFNLSKEEYELLKDKEKKDKDKEDNEDKKKEKDGKDSKIEPVKIDLKYIEDRTKRFTINSSDISSAVLSQDAEKLYYLSRFEDGHDLWMTNLREKETKLLLKLSGRGGGLQLDKDGKNLFLFSGESIIKIDTEKHNKSNIDFKAEMNLNKSAEREYLFEHIWRQVQKKFYDPNLHGVDWNFYKNEYSKFLPHVSNNYEFGEMTSELLGELNGSHTGTRFSPTSENGDKTARLGLFFDNNFDGSGLKIAEIIDKSPLINASSKIEVGNRIEKIDGIKVRTNNHSFALLNHKEGKNVLLSIYNPSSGKRWDEIVKPISIGRESQLLYERWIKQRRAETEKLSNGRLGYAHVRGMDSRSFREFYSEVLGRLHGKEAIIVDTRFNGGGWLHDDLATFLGGKKYVDFDPRGEAVAHDPTFKWVKKSIVLIGEGNYSDAHGFPYAYKSLGIGKTVGMPIAGTMTMVWWERLQDKTLVFGIPQVGSRDLNGNYLENQQFDPDYKVAQDYDVVTKGRDQQLEKAVEILLNELDK